MIYLSRRKANLKITVYRPNQIGGCITEIESADGTRIIIDIGSNLPNTPVTEGEVDMSALTKGCDGVFITHYHGDHIGEFPDVDENVPVYMGKMAHEIFLNLCKFRREQNIERVKGFQTFSKGDKIKVGDMVVTPYRVDHSAYDSYMFLIECDGKKVLHSGDFRTHGWTGKGVPSLLEQYVRKVDVLICEGTMLKGTREGDEIYAEYDLYNDAKMLMQSNKNVFIMCSSTNIDSLASFYKAAIETGKIIVADNYQASNLEIVTEQAKFDSFVSSLYNFKKRTLYTYKPNNTKLHELMLDKGFCMFIRATPFFDELLHRFADNDNNLLIYSMWEGYLQENKYYTDHKMIAFLEKAKENGCRIVNKHTSGHAYAQSIVEVCKIIDPDIIFPIHSEDTGRFEELAKGGKIDGIVQRLKHGVAVDPMKIIEEERKRD